MFKKICKKCQNKINKNYDFCPYCGYKLTESIDREDYGLLGKTDILEESFFQKDSTMIEKLFNQTMKMFEKQMRSMSEDMNKRQLNEDRGIPINHNIQFFINGKRIYPDNKIGIKKEIQPKVIEKKPLSEEKLEKLKKLPKKEPNSTVRRVGARVVYELEIPGVNDINNILINRLENSIEIKALSNDLVYSKILNVNLPIIRYGLNNGNLILELQGK